MSFTELLQNILLNKYDINSNKHCKIIYPLTNCNVYKNPLLFIIVYFCFLDNMLYKLGL